ncbi:hypothetical protein GGH18_002651 [Coemansia sp. RSA 530]|nr:hypothetical protein GGH18_002651 [Coemansia sp. RSA 530]
MGMGCDTDTGRARDWYERAAAAGSQEAKERLSKGIGGASAESTAALRRHVTQKRQKASGRGKKRGGLLSRDKEKEKDKDKDGTGCIIM